MAELRTARLILRGWRPGDAAALAAMNADPEVMRYVGTGVRDPGRARAEADAFVNAPAAEQAGVWAVEARASGAFLGWVGLMRLAELGEIELAYRLVRSAWGRGVATEAARRVVDHAFGTLGLARLVAVTSPENRASRRVLDKLGFACRGTRAVYGVDGCLYYTLDAAAWRAAGG